MQISLGIPLLGLVLVMFNVIVAAVRPYASPTLMGTQLFVGGMITILISVIDLINPIGITEYEGFFLFISGCINCTAGYFMTLLEIRKQGV
ncbi:MAG: hypothetical protein IT331_22700 [Anaerolineae bacterium]|nr:hypothetical protein [Anaerolineae bacterium]